MSLLLMYKHGLIVEADLEPFSEGLRNQILALKK